MTTITLDDLPVIEGAEIGAIGPDLEGYDIDRAVPRRSMLKLMLAGGTFVGFTMLGLFSNVRRAGAAASYTEHGAGTLGGSFCGTYDPDDGDGNNNGWSDPGGVGECNDDACVGTPDLYMGSWYCSNCHDVAQDQTGDNPFQWHVSGSHRYPGSGFVYGDYPNDVCTVNSIDADAWRWEISSCGSCTPAVYRCHDGFKDDSAGHHFTICQGLVVCNGALWDPC